MLTFIEGEIVQKNPENIIIMNGGIGFNIMCDSGLINAFPAIGEKTRIWTYMNVRENEISLYGFPNQEIKSLFELLITVSGIGPKVASTIIASVSPDAFAIAVINDDYNLLTQIKGIGKKSAQRIVLELKDKLKKSMPNLELQVNNNDPMLQQFSDQNLLGIRNESIAALMVLGYAEREADSAVSKAFQEMQANEIEINLNALLKLALKHLSIL
ncbi:MAG: Holliday junction branch migration protein RuvA [Clostridiaceae bacterium]|nr:Holliday junction branch migration protein RuvA [Clostridiaceae bacterium]